MTVVEEPSEEGFFARVMTYLVCDFFLDKTDATSPSCWSFKKMPQKRWRDIVREISNDNRTGRCVRDVFVLDKKSVLLDKRDTHALEARVERFVFFYSDHRLWKLQDMTSDSALSWTDLTNIIKGKTCKESDNVFLITNICQKILSKIRGHSNRQRVKVKTYENSNLCWEKKQKTYNKRYFRSLFIEKIAMLYNLKKIFSDTVSVIAGLIAWGLMALIGIVYLDAERLELIANNYNNARMIFEVGIHIVLSIAVVIFITASVYKLRLNLSLETEKTWAGMIGSFLWVVIVWCPSCGVTIASAIGIAWLFTGLPFGWLEIKIIGLIVTFVAAYLVVKDVFVCKPS